MPDILTVTEVVLLTLQPIINSCISNVVSTATENLFVNIVYIICLTKIINRFLKYCFMICGPVFTWYKYISNVILDEPYYISSVY